MMNWLDVTTYIGMNFADFIMATMAFTILMPVLAFLRVTNRLEANEEYKKTDWSKRDAIWNKEMCSECLRLIPLAIILALIVFIPTHQKALEVKIAKIKNETVNKENVTKGVETLERIGRKLECKYIGCEKESD